MSETLDEAAPRAAGVTLWAFWRALPVLAALSALTILVSSRGTVGAEPGRLRHASFLWITLVGVAAALAVAPRRLLPASLAKDARARVAEHPWTAALLVTSALGMLGLVAVGLLALHPPAVAQSVYKAWDYLDKRWIAALYLLAVGLVFLPGLCVRVIELLGGGRARVHEPAAAESAAPTSNLRASVAARALLALVVGTLLAVVYVAPLVSRTLDRQLDSHELVQLSGLQSIAQGGAPFIDARTQYGPGQQLVTYELVQATEFTVRGARMAHLLINFVTIALFFAVTLFAFGWSLGGAVIVVALFISPLQVTTFVGWGLLERWFAPYLVGTLAPLILWSASPPIRRHLLLAALGVACGALAWMSQENASTSIITIALVLCAAVIWGRVSIRSALVGAIAFGGALVATLLVLLTATVGMEHLGQAIALYRSGSGLVFAGITNTPWTDADTFLTAPLQGRGPAAGARFVGWKVALLFHGWRAAYRFTPVVIVVGAALTLYLPRRLARADGGLRSAQLLGVIAAAVPLHLLTFFRADSTHFVGTSMALAALMTLGVVCIPDRVSDGRTSRRALAAVALALIFFAVYPFASANTEFNFRTAAQPAATLEGAHVVRAMWGGGLRRQSSPSGTAIDTRLGFSPHADGSCCRSNKLTYAELGQAMHDINSATAGRTVLVDTKRNYSALGTVASAVYFLGDLRVGTRFTEPMMSLWTDADIAAAKRDFLELEPQCLVTGGADYHLTSFVLEHYGSYSTYQVPGPTKTLVYCRS